MVGAKGFEPSTSWSRTRRASQAALRPDDPERGKYLAAGILRISQALCAGQTRILSCCVVYAN